MLTSIILSNSEQNNNKERERKRERERTCLKHRSLFFKFNFTYSYKILARTGVILLLLYWYYSTNTIQYCSDESILARCDSLLAPSTCFALELSIFQRLGFSVMLGCTKKKKKKSSHCVCSCNKAVTTPDNNKTKTTFQPTKLTQNTIV